MELVDDLKEIDGCLRVKVHGGSIVRSTDKCFNLTSNYPKGDGDGFKGHMEEYHPSSLLFHVKNTKGNRQDIVMESAGPMFMNRIYYVEFLDKKLRSLRKSNILEENLFMLLSSVHIVALFRSFTMCFISVVLPVRWLAGKTHELSDCNWGVRSMGRVIDMLETKMMEIQQNSSLFTNEDFMMNLFSELVFELPSLQEYLEHMFHKKRQHRVLNNLGKELPHNLLRKEVFHPDEPSNIDTDYLMNELGLVFAEALLTELRDKRKATHNHLYSLDGMHSWNMTGALEKEAGLCISATNNVSESSFGGLTETLTNHTTIGLTNAGAIAMTRQNGDFSTKPIFAQNKGNIF